MAKLIFWVFFIFFKTPYRNRLLWPNVAEEELVGGVVASRCFVSVATFSLNSMLK